jgi:hypothetical protein
MEAEMKTEMEPRNKTAAQIENEERAHVAISRTAATQLDMLVAAALQNGKRPAGRRANRTSMLEELIALALQTPNAGESESK